MEDLPEAGGVDPTGCRDGLDGAPHPPAVAGLHTAAARDRLPRQSLAGGEQMWLVGLDTQDVVGSSADQEPGGLTLGVQRVAGDDAATDVHSA